ncbi:MAG: nucleotidyltransferase family protein [Prevotella sp.]|nr:nucleotidyltransferase family protein [Prevotella sp.]
MKSWQKQDISINKTQSIISALRQMDAAKVKLLLVMDEGKFHSLISIGDIQRAIIANKSLETPIEGILRKEVKVASVNDDREAVIARMKERRNDFMPVVDDDYNVVDIIFWDDISNIREGRIKNKFNLPVIIMAGGKGTRLRPLTNVLPKPLIPIGEQTMMEDIMDKFVECGCHEFFISVNYKADFIRRYFDNLKKAQYHLTYFQEDHPLGTAGSLHLLKDHINSTFFVSNCDIIIDEDYSQILDFHRTNGNEITMVAALKNYSIPYGTLETGEGGQLIGLTEKPDMTFKINTGMYILEPHLINEIPSDRLYHITFLIEKLLNEGRKVGVFPISEGAWTDIGNWDEYFKYCVK